MANGKWYWTPEEDKLLLEMVDGARRKSEAFEAFAESTGRTVAAAKFRYTVLKRRDTEKKVAEVLPSQLEALIHRLCNLPDLLWQSVNMTVASEVELIRRELEAEVELIRREFEAEVEQLRQENNRLREENETFLKAFNLARKQIVEAGEFVYRVDKQGIVEPRNE
jgi:cell division protein FtsB